MSSYLATTAKSRSRQIYAGRAEFFEKVKVFVKEGTVSLSGTE